MFVLGRLSLILLLGCNQVGLQEVIKWDHVLKTWVHYITLFWVCLFVCFGYTAQASQVVLAVTNLPAKAEVIRDMGSIPGKIPWRRVWQSTPIFLPGKFHGQRSLVGYSPWGHEELDTTEQLSTCMWDFSSQTRDQTHTPCIRRQSFNCWVTWICQFPVFLSCHFYQAVFITFALYCLYI